ncbi:MAG: hypothetical protein J5537_01285 [Lachnospiraceae bacterium]|nr:hypothetical protein [Lachnospiraceae bacterium]
MAQQSETTEKVVTKYDKKIKERKEREAKDKRDQKIAKIVGISIVAVIVLAIAASIGLSVAKKNKAVNSPYIKVGNYDVSKVEFDFYYNSLVSNYINSYGTMISYMGLDTTRPFDEQNYSEEMTWKDFFDKMTVQQILELKACKDDAAAKGFEYDTEEDVKTFTEGVASKAKEDGVSVADFYKKNFGEYASEKNLESYIRETFLVDAYLSKLVDDNMPSEDEISSYYEENKQDYDLVDYRLFLSTPEIGEDDSDEVKEAAIATARENADALADEIKGGADFEEAAAKYEESESEEEDAHLLTDMTYGYVSSVYSDWLYTDGRSEGDTEVFADEENNRFYVIQFVDRRVPEDVNTTIGTTLSSNAVNEYKEELTKNYETKDVAGELRSVVFE